MILLKDKLDHSSPMFKTCQSLLPSCSEKECKPLARPVPKLHVLVQHVLYELSYRSPVTSSAAALLCSSLIPEHAEHSQTSGPLSFCSSAGNVLHSPSVSSQMSTNEPFSVSYPPFFSFLSHTTI